ncbi:MAG: hypothetical protein E2O90_07380 [Alphaproteobacteria bacterium]|nr:hypothetical protein [Pseudomonadota bacterium]TDI65454.1 MAG: hypothetical protein E2O90_07380 [Alphaproteobacteria bacterium]
MPDTDEDARSAALEFARAMAAYWQAALGGELLGFYLVGSLAHDGFNRRYSDIDVALVSENGLTDAMIEDMGAHAAAIAPGLAPKLSLFWSDRGFTKGRFPPLDRIDYLEHAVVLVEREAVRPDRPTLDEVRAYLQGRPFEVWAQRAARFATLDLLAAADHKPYLRAHLYPARLVFSWMTGDVASNDTAVAYLSENAPHGLNVALIARALSCRHQAADPEHLFRERGLLPGQVAACRRMISC